MLSQLLIALIESAVNQVFKLSPNLHNLLSTARQQTLLIYIRDWQQGFSIVYTGQQLIILSTTETLADCAISTDINTLQQLKDPSKITQLIRENKLDLEGDLHLAQTYSKAFSKLEIDWEEHLSGYIGDAGSFQLINRLKAAEQTRIKTDSTLSSMFSALLQDELRVAIHPLELDEFKQRNRQLKADCAQLEQRINALLN
ncbi:ubiquinone biosynthesis accessory factor UbiJ [Pseudoalteromonas tunicata]|uniref:Ubiquinone biosynthesis accessory factor UbiJ n=1 Tax=Pseudoalteromonas tunicata D2 TaxID=87626 RepID=A4CF50_9GAMM|nr:SCP2 sterol-binding domain-containing protein [Pseudoalteromonas tunicata]ATC96243.1 yigP [Pseudoalteromonas tunicata]AXT31756.1 ubiquinone carrier protein [Pseudoalteromonas tunicata]EAR26598.1 putative protein with ubiquinone carrier domain, SCP-like [Pseudoalteromonas tunicata D2]MDP4983152.1 SCP2 sterol-binding domain-containing protein [Pseudoalteromonas tunicata]